MRGLFIDSPTTSGCTPTTAAWVATNVAAAPSITVTFEPDAYANIVARGATAGVVDRSHTNSRDATTIESGSTTPSQHGALVPVAIVQDATVGIPSISIPCGWTENATQASGGDDAHCAHLARTTAAATDASKTSTHSGTWWTSMLSLVP